MFRTRTSLVSKAAQASRFQRDAPSDIDSGCGSATGALRRSQVVAQVVSHADLSGSERPIVHRGRLEEEQFVAAGRLAGVVVALINGTRVPAKCPKIHGDSKFLNLTASCNLPRTNGYATSRPERAKEISRGQAERCPRFTHQKRRAPEGRWTLALKAPAPPSGRVDYNSENPGLRFACPGLNFCRPSGARSPRAMRCV